ncbi:GHMP kinase [candidate division KSB1 bacterium]|nr:GHMP kinase [candidate division KSB1 bacterium]
MRLECLIASRSHIFGEVSQFEIALKGGSPEFQDLSHFFDPGDITVVRVPSRLDVMGGIADYSGANVCEGTLECGVALGAQIRSDNQIHIRSLGMTAYELATDFTCSLESFYDGPDLCSYQKIQELLKKDKMTSWSAYIVGALFVLLKEQKIHQLVHGLNIAIISRVPIRVGIGSSATVEIATLQALNLLFGLGLDGLTLARLGQMTENKVVGAPCGIMDQLAVTWGKRDTLTHIICQPDIIRGNVEIPTEYEFVGINSMVRHHIAGPQYRNVRIGAFMGRKIISLEMQQRGELPAGKLLDYLCHLTPEKYETYYRNLLPESISGEQFLKQYGELEDTATVIDPATTYYVRTRTAHPIYENDRVLKFIDLLNKARENDSEVHLKQAGRLMLASHDSYRRNCELSCPEVDQLIEIIKEEGKKYSVYGAKITGGGSGGTVALVAKKKFLDEALAGIVEKYQAQVGYQAQIFRGSSPGVLEYGHRKYRLYQ